MSKKILFKKIAAGLCAACLGASSAVVSAESQFYDCEKFESMNKAILEHTHSKKMMKLPLYRQAANYTCGVSCVLSILRYVSYQFDLREDHLIEALHASEDYGTKWQNIVGYLNSVRLDDTDHQYFEVQKREHMTVSELINELDQGHPVICAIQAWGCDENGEYREDLDYNNDWLDGHWAIAVGYLRDNIIFMDPSTAANYTYIPKDQLAARWHDRGIDDDNRTYDADRWGLVVKINVDKPECEKCDGYLFGLM